MVRFLALSLLALTISACVPQEQADAKMAKGCAAGVNALIQPKQILTVKNIQYGYDDIGSEGKHRRITIEGVEQDGWLELDKEYTCIFAEQWGFFKSSHAALLTMVKIDDEIYGKKDGKVIGDLDDFLKLTDTVDAAMGQ